MNDAQKRSNNNSIINPKYSIDIYENVRKLEVRVGYTEAKRAVIKALVMGRFSHEARAGGIDQKNKLLTGEVTAQFVANIIRRSTGADHSSSPHHRDPNTEVHVIKKNGWYVKFYFLEPDTLFISVHESGETK